MFLLSEIASTRLSIFDCGGALPPLVFVYEDPKLGRQILTDASPKQQYTYRLNTVCLETHAGKSAHGRTRTRASLGAAEAVADVGTCATGLNNANLVNMYAVMQ